MEDLIIGRRLFTDGLTRAVYLDEGGHESGCPRGGSLRTVTHVRGCWFSTWPWVNSDDSAFPLHTSR
jgi:hypothetical protein